MSTAAQIAAHLLREGRRGLAELVCARMEISARVKRLEDAEKRRERRERAETHIHILAACLEFSSPLLLTDYVGWAAKVPECVLPFYGDISDFLQELETFVQIQFPRDAAEITASFLHTARESLAEAGSQPESIDPERSGSRLQQDYLAALLAARRDDALRLILQALNAGTGIESIYLEVFQKTQQEIGRRWQKGEISVAQEHYCTAATQLVMAQLQPYFFRSAEKKRTLVATCVGEELHEVGLRIVSDLFEVDGWNTVYLGANSPAKSVAQALVVNRAQVLAISTTMAQHLFGMADVIKMVRSFPGCDKVKVLVGGHPFNVDPALWSRIGADASATDVKEAIRIANRFVEEQKSSRSDETEFTEDWELSTTDVMSLAEAPDDLSRLNNALISYQRQLHKANAELSALNKAYHEKAKALQRADRRKDEFLAMLAHELRGPLAPMEFAVALLDMQPLGPGEVATIRETLARQLQQMRRLVGDLLDASRIAHGKIELKLERITLSDALDRALEIVHSLITAKEQQLIFQLHPEPIWVEADTLRLTQILSNLLTDASKYTHHRGRIWVSTKRSGEQVLVEIRDDGVGIEADVLDDIFSPFTQEQRSRVHSMGGLGLGLSVVKQLVELHRGDVEAHSEGAGRGSTFTVTLPVQEAPGPQDSKPKIESGLDLDASGPARRVLIVEDTAGIAQITACLIQKLGHTPFVAMDGTTAVKMFQLLSPEVVLLDMMLPDMTGLDVIRELRKLDHNRGTLIVALTGHSDDEFRGRAMESGCDEFWVKPVDVHTLQTLAVHPKLMALGR